MNNNDLMEENEISLNSKGGTERIKHEIYNGEIPRDLLEKFQIVFSRQRILDNTKYRIYYAHDLAEDPEAENALGNGNWENYHRIVFVTNWQKEKYIDRYKIPYSKCVVMHNFIRPIEIIEKPKDKIKLIYHSTPHRGLDILASVFDKLSKNYDDIELDVFSSFNLYGWKDQDEQFKDLFDYLKSNDKINYYGTVSNDEVRKALAESHVFAYPSTWPETSCLCLMEAMSAGLICVHPNFAALPETAANWTMMYNWHESKHEHAAIFYSNLEQAIDVVRQGNSDKATRAQKGYADLFYNWDNRKYEWINLLSLISTEPLKLEKPKEMFVYRT